MTRCRARCRTHARRFAHPADRSYRGTNRPRSGGFRQPANRTTSRPPAAPHRQTICRAPTRSDKPASRPAAPPRRPSSPAPVGVRAAPARPADTPAGPALPRPRNRRRPQAPEYRARAARPGHRALLADNPAADRPAAGIAAAADTAAARDIASAVDIVAGIAAPPDIVADT